VRASFEVADVLNTHWPQIVRAPFNSWQLRTLDAIRRCRTASMGGHVDQCTSCGHVRISYNSCRNRHCPKCQQIQRERWIQAREAELLPVPYFHVVFTLPEALNRVCLYEPGKIYGLLFETAWEVIQTFSGQEKHLGADTGMVAILHTWGQNLSLHPHLHCIVPGGGITRSGQWKGVRGKGKFLFPVKAMSPVFRARFVARLRERIPGLERSFYNDVFKNPWVIYAKRSFGGPQQVIEYLGGYTHKIAISNHRIVQATADQVTFRYKDYREEGKNKVMTLEVMEFVRRFSLHILPKGFPRIRHYGILSSKRKHQILPRIHQQLRSHYEKPEKKDWKQVCIERLGYNPHCCPVCKQQAMVTLLVFDRRGPPDMCFIRSIIKSLPTSAA
jgi:Putative transposase/Transposase zinc-binding domain